MQFFTIAAALATLAALASAAPAKRDFEVQVTFIGAADAQFSMSIPADGSVVPIYNVLSISHISSAGGATCSFVGIDGSHTVVVGASEQDVGPPQTQVSASCLAL